jgi:hypothetical protein
MVLQHGGRPDSSFEMLIFSEQRYKIINAEFVDQITLQRQLSQQNESCSSGFEIIRQQYGSPPSLQVDSSSNAVVPFSMKSNIRLTVLYAILLRLAFSQVSLGLHCNTGRSTAVCLCGRSDVVTPYSTAMLDPIYRDLRVRFDRGLRISFDI